MAINTAAVNSDLVNVFTTPTASFTWSINNSRSMAFHTSTKFFSTKCSYSLQMYPKFTDLLHYTDDLDDIKRIDSPIVLRTRYPYNMSEDEYSEHSDDEYYGYHLAIRDAPQGAYKKRAIILLLGAMKEESEEKLNLHYRFSILNAKGEKCSAKEGHEFVKFTSTDSTIAMFTIHSDYLSEKGFPIDGKVTFYVEIFELTEPNITTQFQANSLITLSSNMKALLESGKGSDVVLVAGGVELKAHKLILSANSPVFSTMFDNENVEEVHVNRVDIHEMSGEVLQEMLRFIYTGQVLKMKEFAAELFNAAYQFQLESLKIYCEKYLIFSLTMEAIPRILQLAVSHEATHLKDTCLKYITQFADEINGDTFKSIVTSNVDLAFELYQQLVARLRK